MDNFLHYQVEVWKVLVAFGAFYLSFKYFNNASPKSVAKTVAEKSEDDKSAENVISKKEEKEEDEDDLFDGDHDPYSIKDNYTLLNSPFKLVLCVNMELNMTKGKIAAQCGHATLGVYKIASKYCKSAISNWEYSGQAKIALKVDKEDTILELQRHAIALGLVTYLVQDAGRTQIAAGSRTVLAIGPAPASVIDKVTSHLKLL